MIICFPFKSSCRVKEKQNYGALNQHFNDFCGTNHVWESHSECKVLQEKLNKLSYIMFLYHGRNKRETNVDLVRFLEEATCCFQYLGTQFVFSRTTFSQSPLVFAYTKCIQSILSNHSGQIERDRAEKLNGFECREAHFLGDTYKYIVVARVSTFPNSFHRKMNETLFTKRQGARYSLSSVENLYKLSFSSNFFTLPNFLHCFHHIKYCSCFKSLLAFLYLIQRLVS